jgi:serine protease Do
MGRSQSIEADRFLENNSMRSKHRLFCILAAGALTLVLAGCSLAPQDDGEGIATLRLRVQSLEARLQALESKPNQVSEAVAKARAAVAFLWGSYTFIDSTGSPLRHVLDEAGEPISDAQGVPLVDVTGTGSVAVTQYSGTAFLVDGKGHLLTNRHVAEPWWEDESSAPLLAAGLRPVFIQLRAFFQERSDGVPIEVLQVDTELDVALVRTVGWIPGAKSLSVHPESVREGAPVFLVGYPTGLDAVVSRLEYKEQAELEKATGNNDYAKALILAQRKELRPSITGGFLWEVLPNTLVYDAHTIGGSSGGPVLDRQGQVIGINAAYLSGFRAINYGIPIRFGQELLQGRGQKAQGAIRETPELVGIGGKITKIPRNTAAVHDDAGRQK